MNKKSIGLYSTAGCVIIVLICVLLNLLSSRYFFRIDFTENKIYTLSPATQKILAGLTDPLRVRVFFQENLPPEYTHQRRYLEELLQEMKTTARGSLKVEFADMKKPETLDEARRAGVAMIRFTAVREDKFEVQEGMMGLVMYYEDEQEVIPAVTQVSNIEYELAGRIIKLTQKSRPVIGWSIGNGEMEPPASLQQYLTEHFDLRPLDALSPDTSLDPLSVLIVAGPRRPLSDTALRAIDRAVLRGVPTAILLDLYDINMSNFFARKNEVGLGRLLESYGLRAQDGLVADAQNMPVQMQTQQGFFSVQSIVNYPYIPRVTDLSRDHPVTRTLQEIALPFTTALEIVDSTGVIVLARSSGESYRISQPFIVSPTERINIDGADRGPFVLGVSIQAIRRSAFADTTAASPVEGQVRLMVLANSNFLDESRGGSMSNLNLAANLIDWLAATEDLISIRSKTNTFRPLEKVSEEHRSLMKFAHLFLMPLAVAFIGAIRWRIRAARRRRWEESIEGA